MDQEHAIERTSEEERALIRAEIIKIRDEASVMLSGLKMTRYEIERRMKNIWDAGSAVWDVLHPHSPVDTVLHGPGSAHNQGNTNPAMDAQGGVSTGAGALGLGAPVEQVPAQVPVQGTAPDVTHVSEVAEWPIEQVQGDEPKS